MKNPTSFSVLARRTRINYGHKLGKKWKGINLINSQGHGDGLKIFYLKPREKELVWDEGTGCRKQTSA